MTEGDSREGLEVPYPQYHCPVCGTELPLTQARLTITCAEHTADNPIEFEIRDAGPEDRTAVEDICDRSWGETEIDCFGTSFDVTACENVVAAGEDGLLGLISLAVHEGEQAVVLLSVYPEYQGRGVGAALLEAATRRAAARGLPFVKACMSNDDIPSIYFYLRHRFVISGIAVGSVADSIGAVSTGFAGIPIRDEIRVRRPACPA